jgi:hypothetical protein
MADGIGLVEGRMPQACCANSPPSCRAVRAAASPEARDGTTNSICDAQTRGGLLFPPDVNLFTYRSAERTTL